MLIVPRRGVVEIGKSLKDIRVVVELHDQELP